jgi:predicted GTPase
MELNERLVINYDDICNIIRNVLDEIRDLRADSFVRRILSETDLENIRRWENLLQRRLDEPFSIVIMGDFKRGKSSLINAILGKKLAPVNVTPETVTINRISSGVESSREAVLQNGMRIRLEEEEIGRAQLETIMEKLPAPIDYIDIKEPAEILREISIVDTPGMGDVLKQFDTQVQDYLIRSDAVIYVASALSPLSESEQLFLSASLRPQSFSRLFLIVNMSDCLDNSEDVERVKNLVYERVRAVSVSATVFALSALDEFCRKTGKNRPHPEMQGYLEEAFTAFDDALRDDILLQKDVIKSGRLVTISRTMTRDIRSRIELIGKMLAIKKSELADMEQKCHTDMVNIDSRLKNSVDEIKSLTERLSRDARSWMEEFLDRLKKELPSLATGQTTVTLQKHLQFYLMDMIRQAILACLGAHRAEIETALKAAAKEFSKENFAGISEMEIDEITVKLADISWTNIDTATYAIETGAMLLFGQESGALGVINLVSSVVGGFLRESKMQKKQTDIIQPLLDQFHSVHDGVMDQVKAAYSEVAEQSAKRLEDIFKMQLTTSLEALAQAQNVLKNEDIKEDELKEHLGVAFKILDRADALLDSTGLK